MPTRHYSLYQGEPEVITVYWSQLFSRITVDYKGENILTANGWRLLFGVGKNVRLPSGEEINVHTVGLAPRITINDRPLPESPKSIRGKVHSNIILLYFAAGLSILLGILSFFFGETTFCGQDASGPLVISGLTLLGLTYWASKALSIVPYIVIIILITAIGGVAIFYYSSNEYWVEVIGATIILYIYLLYQLLQTASLVLQLRFKREGEARHQTEKRRMLVPTIHCSFHENEPDIISITWGRIHVTVKYKDTIVSVLNHGTILNGPQEVLLPNGEFITLSRQFMGILRVHKDGLLLPGSPGSTRFRVQQVGKLFYYFPGLFCLFGIIQLFLPPHSISSFDAFLLWIEAAIFMLLLNHWAVTTLSVVPYVVIALGSLTLVVLGILEITAHFYSQAFIIPCIWGIKGLLAVRARNKELQELNTPKETTPPPSPPAPAPSSPAYNKSRLP